MDEKMVDRRVLSEDSEQSEGGSDKEQQARNGSDAESGMDKPASGESEYESGEEEEVEASEDDTERPIKAEDPQTVETTLSELVDEEGGQKNVADVVVDRELTGLEEERKEGDGESVSSVHPKELVLDDDEDLRNPQYIPKKGSFYEHDDRVNFDREKKKDVKDKKKKKLWLDAGKWNHDMFREEEQAPKSRGELIAVYGYDIRNDPRARRRYGRGPSKYTSNWQDKNAYAGRLRGDETDPALVRESASGRGRGTRSRGRFARHPDPIDKAKQDNNIPEEGTVVEECNGQPKADHKDAPITNKKEYPTPVSSVIDKKVDAKQQVTNVHRGPTKSHSPTNENGGASVVVESSPTVSSSSIVKVVAPPSAEVVRTQTFENCKLNSNNHGKPKKGDVSDSVCMDTFRSSSMMGGGTQGKTGTSNMANGRGRGRGRGYIMERKSAKPGNWSSSGSVAGEDKLSASMQRLNLKDANNGRHENSHGFVKEESSTNDNEDTCVVHQRQSPPSSGGGEHVSASSSFHPKRYSSLCQRSLPAYQAAAAAASLYITPYYEASEYSSNGIDVVDNRGQGDYQSVALYDGTDAMPAQSQQQVSSDSMVPAIQFQEYNTSPYQETYAIGPPTMPIPPHSSSYQSSQAAAAASLYTTPYYEASEYLPNGIDVVDNRCQNAYQSAAMYDGTDAMPVQTQQQVFSASMVPATHFQGYNTSPYQEMYAVGSPTMQNSLGYYPPVTLSAAQTAMPTLYICPNGNTLNYTPTPTGYAQYPIFQEFTTLPAAATASQPVDPYRLTS